MHQCLLVLKILKLNFEFKIFDKRKKGIQDFVIAFLQNNINLSIIPYNLM